MRSAWANLRAYPGRFMAVLLSIAIGVGFTVATLAFTASFRTDLTRSIGAAASKADVIVYPFDSLPVDRLLAIDGVAGAEAMFDASVQFSTPTARGSMGVGTVPASDQLRWFTLRSGSWPTGLGQVVVDPGTAERNGLTVGGPLTLATYGGVDYPVTVVGVVDLQRSALAGAIDEVFAAPELGAAITGGVPSEIDLTAAAGVAAANLAATVSGVLDASAAGSVGAGAAVVTGAAVVDTLVTQVIGELDVLTAALLAFAVIAGLVASFVVANTFTILLAQRQRQIGLLRCIGASRRQVRRSVLAEALLLGTIGSLGGALLGLAVAWVALPIAKINGSSFTVALLPLTIAVMAGVIVTVLAALAPAARAMRVTPLAALSPVPTGVEARRAGRLRVVAGVVLFGTGGLGLAGGIALPNLLVAIAGGAVSAAGVLVLLRSALPLLMGLVGGSARLAGVPGRLAMANARRNPGRAAATSSALVIAVGLIVTLQVAAASAKSSLDVALADQFPLDVSIVGGLELSGADLGGAEVGGADLGGADLGGAEGGGSGIAELPAGLLEQLRGVDGLTAVVALAGTPAQVRLGGEAMTVTLLGTPADVGSVLRSPAPTAGTVALPGWLLRSSGIKIGDPVTFSAGNASTTLTVADSGVADGGSGVMAVTTAADLARLDPTAAPRAIWGKVADIDRANEAISRIKPVLAPYASLELSGAAADHASVQDGLDTVLLIVTALLAVGAVIAVVGIGNTLGLSVVERTRESALLRALGLRRGQLRLMLAVEAALLAAVGAVVGILAGVGYGWAGAAATFAQAGQPLRLALPGEQLLVVLGLALLAGVAASVLPAPRAATAAPTDALAEV